MRILPLTTFIVAGLFGPQGVEGQSEFHVTFGTTDHPQHRHSDGASFVVETDRGDIVVAGAGAGYSTDLVGSDHTKPLVARFSSAGELQWQSVYTELENHHIVAFISEGEEQYMLVQPTDDQWALSMMRQATGRDAPIQTVSLRRIDENGELSPVPGSLEGVRVINAFPVVSEDLSYFAIVARPINGERGYYSGGLQLYRADLDGRLTRYPFPDRAVYFGNMQHLADEKFLYTTNRQQNQLADDQRDYYVSGTEVLLTEFAGTGETLFTMPGRTCRAITASINRVYCAEQIEHRYVEAPASIVAYTYDGEELWRHRHLLELDPSHLMALESGELLYWYVRSEEVDLYRLSPEGNLISTLPIRSTGHYTTTMAVTELRDGRIAIVGSTGGFNPYTSTDTDAMLIVTRITDEVVAEPEVVPHVVSFQ